MYYHNETPLQHNILKNVPSGSEMPMCKGGNCPHRFLCLRFLAEPVDHQEFLATPPFKSDGTCVQHWDARELFRRVIRKELLEEYAKTLSCTTSSTNDLNWILAKSRQQISALFDAKWDVSKGKNALQIPDSPEHYIRIGAYFLWRNQNHNAKDLHWLIAEQQLLLQALIERINIQEEQKLMK